MQKCFSYFAAFRSSAGMPCLSDPDCLSHLAEASPHAFGQSRALATWVPDGHRPVLESFLKTIGSARKSQSFARYSAVHEHRRRVTNPPRPGTPR